MTSYRSITAAFLFCLGGTQLLPSLSAQATPDLDKLPKLPRSTGGTLAVPLVVKGPLAWRPTQKGIELRAMPVDSAAKALDGIAVSYARQARQAAGVAVAFAPGGLRGAASLSVELAGIRGSLLVVSLRSKNGAVYSWPAQSVSKKPKTLKLAFAKIRLDRMQSRGKSGEFSADEVWMLSIVDISAFMGATSGTASWQVRSCTAAMAKADQEVTRTNANAPAKAMSPEQQMFRALVDGVGTAEDAIPGLIAQSLADPRRGRTVLLLGLTHLWIAAEGNRSDPTVLEHLVLSDYYFRRRARMTPADDRVPSWQVPVAVALARIEDSRGRTQDLLQPLETAYRKDPGFHGFAKGLLAYPSKPGSATFNAGLEALRKAMGSNRDDPSVQNRPNWPHNREGFVLFVADYEHRAGNTEEATRLLGVIEKVPEFASWPSRGEVAERRERWRESADDSSEKGRVGNWLQAKSCVICHRR